MDKKKTFSTSNGFSVRFDVGKEGDASYCKHSQSGKQKGKETKEVHDRACESSNKVFFCPVVRSAHRT